jgi:hypothetical protein
LSSTPDVPDRSRIAAALARHRVRDFFVGGIAGRAHGARRVTYDVDCLPRLSRDNLDRLAAAMRELNARARVGGLSDEEGHACRPPKDRAGLGELRSLWQKRDPGGLKSPDDGDR